MDRARPGTSDPSRAIPGLSQALDPGAVHETQSTGPGLSRGTQDRSHRRGHAASLRQPHPARGMRHPRGPSRPRSLAPPRNASQNRCRTSSPTRPPFGRPTPRSTTNNTPHHQVLPRPLDYAVRSRPTMASFVPNVASSGVLLVLFVCREPIYSDLFAFGATCRAFEANDGPKRVKHGLIRC